MNENCLSVGIICTPAGIGHGEHIFNLNYLISAKSAALPASGSSVRIETLIPWSLVKRGVRRQVITPIETRAEFREEVQRDAQQPTLEKDSPPPRTRARALLAAATG